MATIPQYVKALRNLQWDICLRFGIDMSTATATERALAISGLAAQATLIKLLVDKGVVTDAEIAAAVNAVRQSSWSPPLEPERPVGWDTTPVTGLSVTGV